MHVIFVVAPGLLLNRRRTANVLADSPPVQRPPTPFASPVNSAFRWGAKVSMACDLNPRVGCRHPLTVRTRAQGAYCYVSSITSKTFTTDCSNTLTTQSGANHLVRTGGNIPPLAKAPAPAPVGTTSAPTGTTSAPVSTTAAPVSTTSAPVSTTSAPTPVSTLGAGATCDPTSSRPNQVRRSEEGYIWKGIFQYS